MKISKDFFGKDLKGENVDIFSLENDNGMLIKITNYGGIITHIFHPDKKGNIADLVLGFDKLSDYLGEHPYFGGIIGRVANRIAKGRFSLNDIEYTLAVNNSENHLHGGITGFDKKIWDAEAGQKVDSVFLQLSYLSKDMEEGYPGNLKTKVNYSLNNKNELKIEYFAESDKDTIVNLTNHSYFNLNGGKKNILDHILKLNCKSYTLVNQDSIPTGEMENVEGTPFDFRQAKTIGKDIAKVGMGYDHNYIVQNVPGEFNWFAYAEDPESGRNMEVGTTLPGVQLYTANYVDKIAGKQDNVYNKHHAFCLETQHFPDSINQPKFPSIILKKGAVYQSKTIYRFNS